MDVHKESIALAVTDDSGEVRHHGRLDGAMSALLWVVRKLESLRWELMFVYEARP
jgi:hypothetical protein